MSGALHHSGTQTPAEAANPIFRLARTPDSPALKTVAMEVTDKNEDAELLKAIAQRDEGAMAQVFDRYSRLVYAIALRVLKEPTLAEDVMQEVLLQVWRSPNSFIAQRGSLASWLTVVARNRSIDVLRRRAHQEPLEGLTTPEPRSMAPSVEDDLLMTEVRRVVKQLPEEQQSSLQMAYFDGLSHTEIAERTGIPLGTVKTRIRAGLTAVRKVLEA